MSSLTVLLDPGADTWRLVCIIELLPGVHGVRTNDTPSPLPTSDFAQDLAARVRAKRDTLPRTGRGLRAVARVVGVSPATLSRIERGELPTGDTLVKLLKWLEQ